MTDALGDDMKAFLGELDSMPNPQTPNASTMRNLGSTPTAAPSRKLYTTPVPTRDGMTMYERSKLQMEERERKLKALQDTLMLDYTFTPQSATSSMASSRDSSPTKVFDRLYAVETATMRARRLTPRSANSSPMRTPSRGRVRGTKDGYVTPGRLEALHAEGQNRQRARNMTQKEEDETRRRRMEEDELSNCTFTPNTKWKLAAERRKKQRKEAERAGEELRRVAKPKPSEREQWQRIHEEQQLKNCTFHPKMRWNITKERRDMASPGELLWDDDDDDDAVPKEVARTPRAIKASTQPVSPLAAPVVDVKTTNVSTSPSIQKSSMDNLADTSIKFVSSDEFNESLGKVTTAPSVVRSTYVGKVTPSSPEWKAKYHKIGSKKAESILEAEGSARSNTYQVRSNFSTPIVAGGDQTKSPKKSPSPQRRAVTPLQSSPSVPTLSPSSPLDPSKNENESLSSRNGPEKKASPDENKKSKSATWKERLMGKRNTKTKDETETTKTDEESAFVEEARLKAEQEAARIKADVEAAEKTRLKAEQEVAETARVESDRVTEAARIQAEQDTTEAAKLEAEVEAAEIARLQTEKDAEKARMREAQEFAQLKLEQEDAEATRIKEKEEAEEATRFKVEQEASEAARLKGEQEAAEAARVKAEQGAAEAAKMKAEEEVAEAVRIQDEKDAEEARLKAEQTAARTKGDEEAAEKLRLKAEQDGVAEEARIMAEHEAAAEAARIKSEKKAADSSKMKSEHKALAEAATQMKVAIERKARLKAEKEEAAQATAIKVAAERRKSEEVQAARIQAEQEEATRLEVEQDNIARMKAEEEKIAQIQAQIALAAEATTDSLRLDPSFSKSDDEGGMTTTDDEAGMISTDDDEVLVDKPKKVKRNKSDRAKKWKERLANMSRKEDGKNTNTTPPKMKAESSPIAEATANSNAMQSKRVEDERRATEEASATVVQDTEQASQMEEDKKIVDELVDVPAETQPTSSTDKANAAHIQSDDEDADFAADESTPDKTKKKKKSSDRAKKWKDRLAKRTKSPKRTVSSDEDDTKSDAAIAGGVHSDNIAYPRVILDEEGESKPVKEPEIGAI